MENWITAVPEPRSLFLAWQAPDHFELRHRWAVGTLSPIDDGQLELKYFTPSEIAEFNPGRSHDELLSLSYKGFPAFDLKQVRHREGVLDALMRRLPPATRADFHDFMHQFRLKPSGSISPLALLARTEAKLPSDGFSVVDPLDPREESCDLMLEVAGYRHYAFKLPFRIELGQNVQLVPEPENEHDPYAVRFAVSGHTIGYVNRLQARTFLSWLETRRVECEVERLNGKPDRPRAFIFARIRPAMQAAA